MSNQKGQSLDEKSKCKYEIWQRLNPEFIKKKKYSVFNMLEASNWRKISSYETKELAEKNKYNFKRKMNLDHEVWWDFEIRVKN